MEITAQIVTHNNKATIARLLESIESINPKILIGDAGSNDGTIEMCRRTGCQVVCFEPGTGHDHIRNELAKKSTTEWQIWLNPWETLVQGHSKIGQGQCQKASVVQDTIISQEPRIWRRSTGFLFRNPVYEYLDAEGVDSPICIYTPGGQDYRYNLSLVKAWKDKQPTSSDPCYYYANTLLALGEYDSFLNASEHYMFLETKTTRSSILNRYYYSLVQVAHKKKARSAFQNLNICLSARPLMAEFWCLLGDIYYHLYHNFGNAREFYKNALFLGARRLANDGWPMDISKYDEYPQKMIGSCDEIIGSQIHFA